MNSNSVSSPLTQSLPPTATTPSGAAPAPTPKRDPSIFKNIRFLGFVGFVVFFLVPFFFHTSYKGFFFALVTFLEVALLFNILIIVHELGHFLAAKWCGLKIDKFAIWFGKPIWSKKVGEVDYILGSIPAGGYVALPQMANPESIEGKNETPVEELPPASPWQKIFVAFAGPLFSFGLALVFATLVWVVGKPSTDVEKTTTIGYAMPDGPAARAGLQAGDVIKSINGHPVSRWMGVGDGVTWLIITSSVSPLTIVVDRNGQTLPYQVTPEIDKTLVHHWWERATPPKIQIAPEQKKLIVGKIYSDSPASIAGIQKGDRLVALDGVPLLSYMPIFQHMKDSPNAPLNLSIARAGTVLAKVVQPVRPISPKDIPKDEPQTAIGLEQDDDVDVVLDHPTPWTQVAESVDMVRGTLLALITPHSNVGASQLSGPIGIMNLFYAVLSSPNGWRFALWLAVVINVNLALLNLFPFPILDGGHILLSVIEWIRRRPLSMAILEPLQTTCALLLMSYMVYITFFDVQDSGRMAMNAGDELKFAPRQATP